MLTYTTEKIAELNELTRDWLKKDNVLLDNQSDVDELIDILVFHEWRYYVKNDPIISDFEYDKLYSLLLKTEEKNLAFLRPWSPTQRVASDLTASFDSVAHLVPMLSLANSYNEEDLKDFDKQIRKLCEIEDGQPIEYSAEPKFDGGSIALLYENDMLVRAATRGNGTMGDEITPNAKVMQSVPLRAAFSKIGIHRAELRGEAIIRRDLFERINKKREEAGFELFANPRNAATGGLRTKDSSETSRRRIQTFVYQLGFAENAKGEQVLDDFDSHHHTLELMAGLGFKVPIKDIKVCNGIEEVIEYCRQFEARREEYPYEIDGMVVKVNDLKLHEIAGNTAHHPRWAIAFKFKAKQATTILRDVVYQVGKLGTITPVAKVDPVPLAGVTISSISLHNEEFITGKDLRIGDQVLIERAGDVIPYIVKSHPELRTGKEKVIEFPTNCPINPDNSQPVELEKTGKEAAWRCNICVCGAQDMQRAIFYVSKDAMDIEGLGGSTLKKFADLGWIQNISDIYHLDYDAILELEGWRERSVTKLKESIEKSKKNPLWRLLVGLTIPQLGQRAGKLLASHVESIYDLMNWEEEDFTSIKDIGPILAKNVSAWFKIERNIDMLRRMEEAGVNMRASEEDAEKQVAEDAPLRDKSILFTGSLEQMTRNEAKKMAEDAGARNISAVSSKLDILVVGANAGSKLKKAQDLGTVQILTESEFLTIIQDS